MHSLCDCCNIWKKNTAAEILKKKKKKKKKKKNQAVLVPTRWHILARSI